MTSLSNNLEINAYNFFAGDVTKVGEANIVVYSCPFDMLATETKGTVLIKNADELKNFSKGEENLFEQVHTF